jgi:uncharacterized membrane protein YesL
MAGWFGLMGVSDENPDVQWNEPEKSPMLKAVEVYFRKFGTLVRINFLIVAFNLPALILSFVSAIFFLDLVFPQLSLTTVIETLAEKGLGSNAPLESIAATQLSLVFIVVAASLAATNLVVVGPVQAGIAYLLRNLVREEHIFLWSDFIQYARENWRFALLSSTLSGLAVTLFIVNLSFYQSPGLLMSSQARFIILSLLWTVLLVWLVMQHYLYPMLVTFHLRIKSIYRNCLLFVFLRLPQNLLLLALLTLILIIIPVLLIVLGGGVGILLAFAWYLLFAFSLAQYVSMTIVWPGLERYLISRQKKT